MFGSLEKMYYFCGVRKQIYIKKKNKKKFKNNCSNACIYEIKCLPLYR